MQTKWLLFLIVAMGIISPLHVFAGLAEIKLATQRDGHQLFPDSLPLVRCAMEMIDRPYIIKKEPWARAQRGTEDGTLDGFFIATKNKKRDAYAVFAKPFYSIRWLYIVHRNSAISPGDNDFYSARRFAANLGSARLTWLEEKQKKGEIVKEIIKVAELEQAMAMLRSRRVDVVLVNGHFWDRNIKMLSPALMISKHL